MQGISLMLGLIWFSACTVVCTLGWLSMNYWMESRFVLGEGLVHHPFWHAWQGALLTGVLLGLVAGVFATFHPLRNHRISGRD